MAAKITAQRRVCGKVSLLCGTDTSGLSFSFSILDDTLSTQNYSAEAIPNAGQCCEQGLRRIGDVT